MSELLAKLFPVANASPYIHSGYTHTDEKPVPNLMWDRYPEAVSSKLDSVPVSLYGTSFQRNGCFLYHPIFSLCFDSSLPTQFKKEPNSSISLISEMIGNIRLFYSVSEQKSPGVNIPALLRVKVKPRPSIPMMKLLMPNRVEFSIIICQVISIF